MTLPLTFPILAIGEFANVLGYRDPDTKVVEVFKDLEAFTIVGERTVEAESPRNALLFDSAGHAWKVLNYETKGLAKKLNWFSRLFYHNRVYRLEYDLEDRGPYTLDALKAQLCDAVDSDPGAWADEELVAGETGTPYDQQKLLNEQKARIGRAASLDDLISVVSAPLDWQLEFGP